MIPTLQLGQFGRGRIASAAPATDPFFASVVLLLHGNGTNGSTTITDSSSYARTVTAVGNAQISTSVKKYGTGSIALDGTGDYLTVPQSSDFNIQNTASDFTLEAWVYRNSAGTTQYLCSKRSASLTDGWEWRINSDGKMAFFHTGGSVLSGFIVLPTSAWSFLMVRRTGTLAESFVDGVPDTSATFSSGTPNTDATLKVGVANDLTDPMNGYFDDFRFTNGVARANVVPSAQFPDS